MDRGWGIIKVTEEQTEICYNRTQNTAKEDEGIAVGREQSHSGTADGSGPGRSPDQIQGTGAETWRGLYPGLDGEKDAFLSGNPGKAPGYARHLFGATSVRWNTTL